MAALREQPELARDLDLATKLATSLDGLYEHPDLEEHLAAWEIERDRCPVHGGPRSECPDAERDWFPQRHVCLVEMQLKAAQRRYDEIHKDAAYHDGSFQNWAEKPSLDYPFKYNDGVTIWLSSEPGSDEEDWLQQAVSRPTPPVDSSAP